MLNPHKPTSRTPTTPQTPTHRPALHTYSSPTTLRLDPEESLIIHLTSRCISLGLSGSSTPSVTTPITPLLTRRAGDFRQYTQSDFASSWRRRVNSREWGGDYTLYKTDLRNVDLGFVADLVDRIAREAYSRELCIDSKPRAVGLVVETGLALPLLHTVLGVLFGGFGALRVGLWADSVCCTLGAGVRSACVVDVGWEETCVTIVSEFREVGRCRSVRAGRWLSFEVWKMLVRALGEDVGEEFEGVGMGFEAFREGRRWRELISFEEVEDLVERVVWCRPMASNVPTGEEGEGHAMDETDDDKTTTIANPGIQGSNLTIPLTSTYLPTTLYIPFATLSQPTETTLFDTPSTTTSTPYHDDHELPLPALIHKALLPLPHDIRAQCLSRILITGISSHIPGLKPRLLAEVTKLVQARGWDPVMPSIATEATQKTRSAHLNRQYEKYSATNGKAKEVSKASMTPHDQDPIDNLLAYHTTSLSLPRYTRGSSKSATDTKTDEKVGGLETIGAWSGASLATELRLKPVASIEKEAWGVGGSAGRHGHGKINGHGMYLGAFGTGG